MKVLITGIAGFVGSTLAKELRENYPDITIVGIDNFIRSGSERNRALLQSMGIQILHGDIRIRTDLEPISAVDWVIDAAANPSVLAGIDGQTSSRQLLEHNLSGTIELLEFCKMHRAGFILLSTSRVYSIPGLSNLKVDTLDSAFKPVDDQEFPKGISRLGVSETYSTAPPVSLYGASKVASETLALEYSHCFDIPVWVNRCGVLAGAGQFGKVDQGIFSFWINSYQKKSPLKYIGFGGNGYQVRDCLHPKDLVPVLLQQMDHENSSKDRICNFGGGLENTMSLAQLSNWCSKHCEKLVVEPVETMRQYDIPWLVLDNRKAKRVWGWEPKTPIKNILDEILNHAKKHPDWLILSSA